MSIQYTFFFQWFDFGPRAYRRMECDVKDEPDDFAKKITDWCPWQDCCLNYAAFTPSQIAQLSLISSIGGGGSPIGGGILPIAGGLPALGNGGSIFGNQLNIGGGLSTPSNNNLLYLLAASSSSSSLNLETLFCPYRNLFPSLIDLTDTTEGCCSIPKCYHKKQVRIIVYFVVCTGTSAHFNIINPRCFFLSFISIYGLQDRLLHLLHHLQYSRDFGVLGAHAMPLVDNKALEQEHAS